jgi:hypothetical protein
MFECSTEHKNKRKKLKERNPTVTSLSEIGSPRSKKEIKYRQLK